MAGSGDGGERGPFDADAEGISWARRTAQEIAALRRQCSQNSPLIREVRPHLDFRYPAEWFPRARARGPRTIHCHVGPTNSGKTFGALEHLRAAPTGVYCAPLRLLAMEMHEKLNKAGKPCALRTGEHSAGPAGDADSSAGSDDAPLDRAALDGVPTLCCTVEMLNYERSFDVAVIDEIQMVADADRGWAFTQALLGVDARDIYVCGEEAALPLVAAIAAATGDRLLVKRYARLSPLAVAPTFLEGGLASVASGDCVIAFSRRAIFDLKAAIEAPKGASSTASGPAARRPRCSVVYGALPMENRSLQARAFNDRADGDTHVLVASDAIGMGLNLTIRRVIFSTLRKYDGHGRIVRVAPSAVKQIAGRAGRFFARPPGVATGALPQGTTSGEEGIVTCLEAGDMEYLQECMETPNAPYTEAGIQPTPAMVDALCNRFPSVPFSVMMVAVATAGRFSAPFAASLGTSQLALARLIDERHGALPTRDKLVLSTAPVRTVNVAALTAFDRFIGGIAAGRPVRIGAGHASYAQARTGSAYLEFVEGQYLVYDLYLWLGERYPDLFIDRAAVLGLRREASAIVARLLAVGASAVTAEGRGERGLHCPRPSSGGERGPR